MAKEKSVNPAAAQRKADKNKAIKKSKLEQRTRQTEKLARKNPDRLQKQIDELKGLEASGKLREKDKKTLEALERDIRGVKRARETLGKNAPRVGGGGGGERGDRREVGDRGGSLGKRRRGSDTAYHRQEESETDEEVRSIPMPRDTPPPIPRRPRQNNNQQNSNDHSNNGAPQNQEIPKPAVQKAQITYSAAPVIRNLAKEARRFMPSAVKQNIARQKGEGGRLLEPEEADRLEKAGYRDARGAAEEAEKEEAYTLMAAQEEARAGAGAGGVGLGASFKEEAMRDASMAAEEAAGEIRHATTGDSKNVEMEEVLDDGL